MRLREFRQSDMKGEWAEGVGVIDVREDSIKMTVIDNGVVVALGGAVVGDEVFFWMQVKKHIKHTVGLIRTIKESIRIIMEQLGVCKARAVVRDGFVQGHRTLQLLGFKLTGDSMEHDNEIYDWYEIWHNSSSQ